MGDEVVEREVEREIEREVATDTSSFGLRPTGNWVVIDPVEKDETSAAMGQIYLPQTSSRKSNEGVIVAVGPGRREYRPDIAEQNVLKVRAYEDEIKAHKYNSAKFELNPTLPSTAPPQLQDVYEHVPIDLKIGDRVLYVRWAGYAVDVDGHKYFVVEEQNVLLVAEKDGVDLQFYAERR
jgi:co-chaperonin GroES (HSP10)